MSRELVPVAAPPPLAAHEAPTPNDRNPALVYLARLGGETSAEVMARCLARTAKVLAGWMGPAAEGLHWTALPWASLRYAHVAALRAHWLRQGLKARSVNQLLAAVKGVLDEAENLELLPPGEAARIVKVKGAKVYAEDPAGRDITDDEVRRMVGVCDTATVPGLRDLALLALLFGGGLRRREASKLRVSDFDRTRGELHVRGKGKKERTVPLSTDAQAMVAAWIARAPVSAGQPLLVAFKMRGGGVREKGGVPTALTSSGVYAVLLAIGKRAGVSKMSPHDARRTRITKMLLAGEALVLVQRIAGHESVNTTGRYARTHADQAKAAAERVPMVGGDATAQKGE